MERLLARLLEQRTDDVFSYSVVVVDNDRDRSAEAVVEGVRRDTSLHIDYVVEPVQGIANARNTAVANARGDYLALIDDDEVPIGDWLYLHLRTLRKCHADGVLGPVIPQFEATPPDWVIKARLCERERFRTGTRLSNSKYTRTGNTLLSSTLFDSPQPPFDPRFSPTGGEDTDFFKRMLEKGLTFVWCDEAIVHESVPASRLDAAYFLRRALLRGIANAQGLSTFSASWMKSVAAVGCYALALPVLSLAGRHRFMKALISLCDHLGKVLATAGLRLLHKRTF